MGGGRKKGGSEGRRERGSVTFSKTGQGKIQEAQEADSAQEQAGSWRLSSVPSADLTCKPAVYLVENKVI